MQISGVHDFAAELPHLAKALQQPGLMAAFVGTSAEITETGPGLVQFVIRRTLGKLTVQVPGTIRVRPTDRPDVLDLEVTAKQMLAGRATVSLKLALSPDAPGRTRMAYDGTVAATGLIQAALAARSQAVAPAVAGVFARFAAALAQRGPAGGTATA